MLKHPKVKQKDHKAVTEIQQTATEPPKKHRGDVKQLHTEIFVQGSQI